MPTSSWIQELKKLGYATCAMALKENARRIDDPVLKAQERLAVILGTEGDGLAPSTIADCDFQAIIPMTDGIDSLNVAAASAVAFWELGITSGKPRGTVLL
jgi:tRNA G18 (ribose-2'-O)-methylase SpoU